jgi:hypothetical protein
MSAAVKNAESGPKGGPVSGKGGRAVVGGAAPASLVDVFPLWEAAANEKEAPGVMSAKIRGM